MPALNRAIRDHRRRDGVVRHLVRLQRVGLGQNLLTRRHVDAVDGHVEVRATRRQRAAQRTVRRGVADARRERSIDNRHGRGILIQVRPARLVRVNADHETDVPILPIETVVVQLGGDLTERLRGQDQQQDNKQAQLVHRITSFKVSGIDK